ncbi:hypothetical protein [Nostoc sp. UHCC 0252]|uniref:hypothetical protein n=1 Tax=Nostoc sp. UHCC 0252 TaxID=3110241 RepID=UPI002B1F2866|nr:hypothetical protein [Nostoc sp. UHCC 0252]MEA5606242.1 hypothetical protein [Nostoc sp. UHCC 0252]
MKSIFLPLSILIFLSLCTSCSSIPKDKLTELGFPLNQAISIKYKVDWVQWGQSKSGGPDDAELVLSENKMRVKIPKINGLFSLDIVRWEGTKFIAKNNLVYHPYYCEINYRQLRCQHNKLPEVDYQSIATYTLLYE